MQKNKQQKTSAATVQVAQTPPNLEETFFFPKDREAGSLLLGPSDDDDDLPPRSRELKHLQHPANQNSAERRQSRSILDSFFSPLSISGRSGGAGNTQEGLIKGPFHHPLHPAPSPPHPPCISHSVAPFSIPALLMELKSMTISVLLGLNCLQTTQRGVGEGGGGGVHM